LTDILLRDVNAERSDALLVEFGACGVIRVPKSRDIVAHLVLDGSVTIKADQMQEAVVLHKGEYGLVFYGSGHRVYVDAYRPSGKSVLITEWPIGSEPKEMKVGRGNVKAKVISAALRLVHNPIKPHPENPMSDVFLLGLGAESIYKNGVLLTDTTQIEAGCHGPGANAFINTLMNLHLTHAMRCVSMNLEHAFRELTGHPYLMSSDKNRAVATAVRLLQTHPERNWTVASLASEVGLSRTTFAAMFCSCVGNGPMEYLNKVRMKKATELLMEQRLELPLHSIAIQVGYSAASSFARAFKIYYGLAPRAFCRQNKNVSEALS
jgi:AraC-like DNA-binding protein